MLFTLIMFAMVVIACWLIIFASSPVKAFLALLFLICNISFSLVALRAEHLAWILMLSMLGIFLVTFIAIVVKSLIYSYVEKLSINFIVCGAILSAAILVEVIMFLASNECHFLDNINLYNNDIHYNSFALAVLGEYPMLIVILAVFFMMAIVGALSSSYEEYHDDFYKQKLQDRIRGIDPRYGIKNPSKTRL